MHWAACVARIRDRNGYACGTGFLISHRHLLTCAHVVNAAFGLSKDATGRPEGKLRLDLPFADAMGLEADITAWYPPVAYAELGREPLADIAVLRLSADAPASLPLVRIARRPSTSHRSFRTFGFPVEQGQPAYGETLDEDAGRWVHVAQKRDFGHLIKTGFSGAPVFAEDDATVVGMVVAVEASGERVAYVLPPDLLGRALPVSEPLHFEGSVSPYKGLKSFGRGDAADFFGRETFVDGLVRELAASPAIAVIGPSGSGKSSVVSAGLLPRLAPSEWIVAHFRPGPHPIWSLVAALVPLAYPDAELEKLAERKRKLVADLGDDPGYLSDWVRHLRRDRQGARVLLVMDQFEEFFTLLERDADGRVLDEGGRHAFVEAIGWIARQTVQPAPLALIATLRADFTGHMLADATLGTAFEGRYSMLRAMNAAELGRAVREPVHRLGVTFEEGLDDEILAAVAASGNALPLMQSALKELWDQRKGGRLTRRAYEAMGGIEGALRARADEAYAALPLRNQHRARRLLARLVRVARPGQGEDTKRPQTREELGPELWEAAQELAGERARLVVTHLDEQGRETADLAHEALLRHWPRLKSWIEDDRRFRLLLDEIMGLHQRWVEARRPSRERLLTGRDLKEALESRARLLEARPELEAFIDTSVKEAKAFPEWAQGDVTVSDLGPDADPCNVTGVWRCDDGGTYYIRNIGRQVWWHGFGKLPHFSFANVAYGHVEDASGRCRLLLRWADIPIGTANIHGHLLLELDFPSLEGRVIRMSAIESSGKFLGSRWEWLRLWGPGGPENPSVPWQDAEAHRATV